MLFSPPPSLAELASQTDNNSNIASEHFFASPSTILVFMPPERTTKRVRQACEPVSVSQRPPSSSPAGDWGFVYMQYCGPLSQPKEIKMRRRETCMLNMCSVRHVFMSARTRLICREIRDWYATRQDKRRLSEHN